MDNGSGFGFAGSYQCSGSKCAGKHRQSNAADTMVRSKYGKSDAAHTMGEHGQSDAADTVVGSEYGKSDAAHAMGEHGQPDAADALEVVRRGSAQAD